MSNISCITLVSLDKSASLLQKSPIKETIFWYGYMVHYTCLSGVSCLDHVSAALHHRTTAHCNTLQHTATQHCNTLGRTERQKDIATHCSTLQHTATHCHTLPHTATHCNDTYSLLRMIEEILQIPAPHCNTRQHVCSNALHVCYKYVAVCCSATRALQCVVCCSVVQCGAVWCSVVQCVAVCCSVLQCVAVCCSTLFRIVEEILQLILLILAHFLQILISFLWECIWMSRVTQVIESFHTCDWVQILISFLWEYIWRSRAHFLQILISIPWEYIWMNHLTHTNESSHT